MCSPTLVFVSSEDNSLQGSANRIERSLDGTGTRVHMSGNQDEQTVPNVQGDEGARDRDKDNKEHTMIHARTDAYVLTLFLKEFAWGGFVFRVSHDVGRGQPTGLSHLSPARTR